MTLPESIFLFIAGLFSALGERLYWLAETLWQVVRERYGTSAPAQRWRMMLSAALLALLVTGSVLGVWLLLVYRQQTQRVTAQLAAGQVRSRIGLYAAPRLLRVGQSLTPEALQASLQRAGYRAATNAAPGTFDPRDRVVNFYPLPHHAETPAKVAVQFANAHLETLTADGVPGETYLLDPELLGDAASLAGTRLASDAMPAMLAAALSVGAEDVPQGSIIRQLAENTTLAAPQGGAQTLTRWAIERQLSPAERLAWHGSTVYLGQRGGVPVYGVTQGAQVFFGKDLAQLSLAESAMLAALSGRPYYCAPDLFPDAARDRRNAILAMLVRDGHISREVAAVAAAEPVQLSPLAASPTSLAKFAADAQREAAAHLSASPEAERAARVYTTLSDDLQTLAEETVTRRVTQWMQTQPGVLPPQAALIALDTQTGQILAALESDSRAGANTAPHPASGVLSPLVYAAALEQGISPLATFSAPAASLAPVNYAGPMMVSLREGLTGGVDAVTLGVAQRAGPAAIAQLASNLQLKSSAANWSATPLAVAGAYTAFANGGQYAAPTLISRISDAHGQPLGPPAAPPVATLTPATAYMLTHSLQAIVQPEAQDADSPAPTVFKTALAGKPGRMGEGWFVGYTPHLVCVLWLGYTDGTSAEGLDELAWLTWQDFIRTAISFNPDFGGENFAKPDDVRVFRVDLSNGQLANGYCERAAEVALLSDQVPAAACQQHTRESYGAPRNEVAGTQLFPNPMRRTAAPLAPLSVPSSVTLRGADRATSTTGASVPAPPPARQEMPQNIAPPAPLAVAPSVPARSVPPDVARTIPPATKNPSAIVGAPPPALPPLVLPPPIIRTRPARPATAGRRAAGAVKGLL